MQNELFNRSISVVFLVYIGDTK